jgi:hypothetical protein
MIVCAAIKLTMNNMAGTELVVCGHRHADCLEVIHQLNSNWINAGQIHGFINHKGEFLDRKQALAHALEIGQLSQTHIDFQTEHHIHEMFSEDLY